MRNRRNRPFRRSLNRLQYSRTAGRPFGGIFRNCCGRPGESQQTETMSLSPSTGSRCNSCDACSAGSPIGTARRPPKDTADCRAACGHRQVQCYQIEPCDIGFNDGVGRVHIGSPNGRALTRRQWHACHLQTLVPCGTTGCPILRRLGWHHPAVVAMRDGRYAAITLA
jgi:hypothetical protein